MSEQPCLAACAHLGQKKLLLDITQTGVRLLGNVCIESNTCVKIENTFVDPLGGRTITTNKL